MDAYLLSDPTSYLFWSVATKRILLAAFLSVGLFLPCLKHKKKYWPISITLIVISMIGSFFIVPETLSWVYYLLSFAIHSYAIYFKVYLPSRGQRDTWLSLWNPIKTSQLTCSYVFELILRCKMDLLSTHKVRSRSLKYAPKHIFFKRVSDGVGCFI